MDLLPRDKKFILLDRDGTINVERKDYVKSYDEFIFLDGAIKALQFLMEKEFKIILITNQSVVGREIISDSDLKIIHERMVNNLLKEGVIIHDIFYCPSAPKDNSFNRKPNPGMIIEASKKHGFECSKTYFIGDTETDMIAGKRAGCKTLKLDNNDLLSACHKLFGEATYEEI
tara:strand:+ start:498 stop:1016 length:519 start_codon:yes stop_codon:yes gene_type:complete